MDDRKRHTKEEAAEAVRRVLSVFNMDMVDTWEPGYMDSDELPIMKEGLENKVTESLEDIHPFLMPPRL